MEGLPLPQGEALGTVLITQAGSLGGCPLFSREEPGLARASTLSGLKAIVFENHSDINISSSITSGHAATPSTAASNASNASCTEHMLNPSKIQDHTDNQCKTEGHPGGHFGKTRTYLINKRP